MNVLSLFDGISCGRVALERAGVQVDRYYAYEIEPNAIKISQKNWPDIVQCGSVIGADFSQYKGIDLLIGGSPCQSISIIQSKTRQNLDGKSKLFYEFIRALEECQPRYFLFENVNSMNEETKQIMSECFGCQPVFLDSADFSAQSRPRLYWTNIPLGEYKKCTDVLADILEDNVDEKYYYTCGFDLLDINKVVCAKLHINGHDLIKRVNSPLHKCQTLTCANGGNHQRKIYELETGRCRKLTPVECERLQTLPDGYTAGVSNTARWSALGNGWTVEVIAYLLKELAYINKMKIAG